jgi:serine/threonine-protein kinase
MPTVLRPDLPPAVDGVFARVLAKQPGDRYANCREFIEAMRVALGSLAADPRTLGSLDIVGAAPTGGDQASLLTEPFRPPEVSHDLPIGTVAAGAQAGSAKQGDTAVSHRRQPGEAPPGQVGGTDSRPPPAGRPGGRRRWFARPGWIAVLTALVLIAAGAGTWALMVTDAQAAGRVFCTFTNGQEDFVWTQDDGHLLGYVAGPVHEDVWNWWVGVHHNIGFASSPMNM